MSKTAAPIAIPKKVTHGGKTLDLASTPGGTIYGTTPGGTRIKYTSAQLLQIRNSPLAKSPAKNMPVIPGITIGSESPSDPNSNKPKKSSDKAKVSSSSDKKEQDDELFEMDS